MDIFDDETGSPPTGALPIADYKHLPKLTIEGIVPSLQREELETVLRYENSHRNRTPLIRLLMSQLRVLRHRAR
ncbi:hypothetical protein ACIOC1_16720 [Streptomyces sp. NPDC088197]|uniref:hypothetical protein n=1 Tax=unclassified Streptomyces TaxID=2593676 RepID=UPI0033A23664